MEWHNVSKKEPCPICHKTDWCNLSNDGVVAICHRVESPYLAKSGSGWIHRLREEAKFRVQVEERTGNIHSSPSPSSFALSYDRIHAGYDADAVLVEGLATELGVDADALKAMDVRFNRMDECWSFPMRDAEGNVVGLRYRELAGSRKWSARGSKDGLFYENGGRGAPRFADLVIVEGASDTAAALSLGLDAVGRSSCQTGGALLRQMIRVRRPRTVTIVADNDEPGIKGAEALATMLAHSAVRVLVVPHPWKDLRAWYLSNRLTPKVFRDIASAQRWC